MMIQIKINANRQLVNNVKYIGTVRYVHQITMLTYQ